LGRLEVTRPEFLAINPNGLAIIDHEAGGFPVFESWAILIDGSAQRMRPVVLRPQPDPVTHSSTSDPGTGRSEQPDGSGFAPKLPFGRGRDR
jgi:hypothetical protein